MKAWGRGHWTTVRHGGGRGSVDTGGVGLKVPVTDQYCQDPEVQSRGGRGGGSGRQRHPQVGVLPL